jgi:hypothetical protein
MQNRSISRVVAMIDSYEPTRKVEFKPIPMDEI